MFTAIRECGYSVIVYMTSTIKIDQSVPKRLKMNIIIKGGKKATQ